MGESLLVLARLAASRLKLPTTQETYDRNGKVLNEQLRPPRGAPFSFAVEILGYGSTGSNLGGELC